MDLNLPGMSGIECTGELKRRCPACQVVMVTIEKDSDQVFAALRGSATGYLLKTATLRPWQSSCASSSVWESGAGAVPLGERLSGSASARLRCNAQKPC